MPLRISIIVPVFNEQKTVLEIIRRLLSVLELNNGDAEFIVVDDGSIDGSRELLQNSIYFRDKRFKFIFHRLNMGKGSAILTGLKQSRGTYTIIQDADLEYDPQDYRKLVEQLSKNTHVVYGSRFSGDYKDMTNLHYFGNRFLTILTNLLYGTHLTDMETCYKLLPGDFVRSLKLKSERFDFEPEITSKILKSGMKILEVPISYKGRSWKDGKKITWRDGLHAVKTLIRFRFFD